MGSRAQVHVVGRGTDVYLYTHWKSLQLEKIVKEALQHRQRWVDAEYLARIVFEGMIKNDIGSFTGYGIGSTEHFDIELLITLNCSSQMITIDNKISEHVKTISFDTFIGGTKNGI